MTKSESVQRAYQWACQTEGDKRATRVALLLAKKIKTAFESTTDREAAFEPILTVIREWHSSDRDSQKALSKVVAKLMKIDPKAEAVEVS